MGTLCRQRPDDGRAREVMCGSQVGKGKGEVEWGRAFQASGSFEIANHKPPAVRRPELLPSRGKHQRSHFIFGR